MSHHPPADNTLNAARIAAPLDGPLGIIAGRGVLPAHIAEKAEANGIPVHIVGIRGEADAGIGGFPHTWIKWGEVGKLFDALKKSGCKDIVIIGGVNRPNFENIRVDLGALKTLPFLLSLAKGGDDHILSRIVGFFEQKGYRVHGAGDVLPELLVPEGSLAAKSPSTEDQADIKLAFEVVRAMGRLDIGQAAVVANGHVLAVEAAEGTDAMLKRVADIKRQGRSHGSHAGVLVKAPKPQQEERIDMPTIGVQTVEEAAAAGLSGIAAAAGHVLLANRAGAIDKANAHKLFLIGETFTNADS